MYLIGQTSLMMTPQQQPIRPEASQGLARSAPAVRVDLYEAVRGELVKALGDIMGNGIIKKALEKVNATPANITPEAMARACDLHIEPALSSFMGTKKAHEFALGIKRMCKNV